MLNFKRNISYNEMKRSRTKQLQYSSNDYETKRKKALFQLGLTDDEIKETQSIVDDIMSDDIGVISDALFDFNRQANTLPNNAIISFLSIVHIQRIFEYLRNQDLSEQSIRLLSRISESEDFTFSHDLIDFVDCANFFLNLPNPNFVLCAVNIIGNASRKSADFRNKAFENKIFHIIKDCENVDKNKIAWALESALKKEPYESHVVEEISQMLIELSENSDDTFRHHAIKAFYYLELHKNTEFHYIIIDNRYIGVLTDVIVANAKPKYTIMALKIISGCCICGNDCLEQIFAFNTINCFSKIINPEDDEHADDEYMETFLDFLINTLVSQCNDMYIYKIIDCFANQSLENIFKNHSTYIHIKGTNAIQRLFFVIDNPKILADALNPFIIDSLADLLFISDNLNMRDDGDAILKVLVTFENIIDKLLMDDSTNFVLGNILQRFAALVNSDEYDQLMYDDSIDENTNIVEHLTTLKDKVMELMIGNEEEDE